MHRSPFVGAVLPFVWACSGGSSPKPPPDAGADAGAPPVTTALRLSPDAVDFGMVASGLARARDVAVSNLSDEDLDLAVTVEPSDQAAFVLSPPGTIHLAAHEATTLVATFTPPPGSNETYQATFDLSYCASGCVGRLDLVGVASTACLTVQPTRLDFGFSVGERGVSVVNSCDQPYSLSGSPLLTSTVPDVFRLANDTPGDGARVPAGGELWIGLIFVPTNAQLYDGNLSLGLADPIPRQVDVHITGYGGGGPRASCTPLSLDFGPNSVGLTSTLSLECTNVGADVFGHPETELFILPHSDNPSFSACVLDPETGKCVLPDGGGIHPDETAFVDVVYAPAEPGTAAAQLTLFTNGLDPQPVVMLGASAETTGKCEAQVIDPLLEFGNVSPGQAGLLSFGIKNLGEVECLVDGLRIVPDLMAAEAGEAPPFALAQAHTWYRLAAGAMVNVPVEFLPPASGQGSTDFNGQVEFILSNPNSPRWVVTLTGSSR